MLPRKCWQQTAPRCDRTGGVRWPPAAFRTRPRQGRPGVQGHAAFPLNGGADHPGFCHLDAVQAAPTSSQRGRVRARGLVSASGWTQRQRVMEDGLENGLWVLGTQEKIEREWEKVSEMSAVGGGTEVGSVELRPPSTTCSQASQLSLEVAGPALGSPSGCPLLQSYLLRDSRSFPCSRLRAGQLGLTSERRPSLVLPEDPPGSPRAAWRGVRPRLDRLVFCRWFC